MTATMAVRLATRADAEAVAELLQLALPAEDTVDAKGLLRVLWDDPDNTPDTRLVALLGDTIIGCAFGKVRSHGADIGSAGHVKLIAVHPAHRRGGVATRLLNELEQTMLAAGASQIWIGASMPRYWWPGVDRANTAAVELFTRAGYDEPDEAKGAADLRVNLLTLPPRPREATGAEIRRLDREEWPAFETWMRKEWGAPWQEEVALTVARHPVSCFVATIDGDYAGFAAYDTNRSGWFGPMGTSASARGHGVGGALLRRCLDDFVARGLTHCTISWVGPREFYQNALGAEVAREFALYRRFASTWKGPSE